MKNLMLGRFACLLVAACGGSDPAAADAATADAAPLPGPPDAHPADAHPPDATPVPPPCDPVAQDCGDPGLKCTIVFGMGGVTPMCVAVTGTAGDGEVCMRDTMTGADTCIAGFTCTSAGGLSPMMGGMRYCRRFCGADTDCAADPGQLCASFGGTTLGDCLPTCAFFGADCAAGLTCGQLREDTDGTTFVPTCRGVGTVVVGMPCSNPTDCVADAVCAPNGMSGTCTAECDPTHACVTGTCTTVPNLPGGAGLCQ